MSRYRWLIVVVVLAALIGGAGYIVSRIRRTIDELVEAEYRLHATILTCRVVGEHLKRNDYAAWPGSWDELRAVPTMEWGPFVWPRDSGRIEQLVIVDFGVKVRDISFQSTDAFRAIRPNGPAAATYLDVGVWPLLSDTWDHFKVLPVPDAPK